MAASLALQLALQLVLRKRRTPGCTVHKRTMNTMLDLGPLRERVREAHHTCSPSTCPSSYLSSLENWAPVPGLLHEQAPSPTASHPPPPAAAGAAAAAAAVAAAAHGAVAAAVAGVEQQRGTLPGDPAAAGHLQKKALSQEFQGRSLLCFVLCSVARGAGGGSGMLVEPLDGSGCLQACGDDPTLSASLYRLPERVWSGQQDVALRGAGCGRKGALGVARVWHNEDILHHTHKSFPKVEPGVNIKWSRKTPQGH
eukprot:1159857-Pelagomonas_calceolata.AAC.6